MFFPISPNKMSQTKIENEKKAQPWVRSGICFTLFETGQEALKLTGGLLGE